jgi:hypothetical protein
MFAHKADDVIWMSRLVYIVIVKAREELRQNREYIQNGEIYEVAASKRCITQKSIKYQIGLQVLRIENIPNN